MSGSRKAAYVIACATLFATEATAFAADQLQPEQAQPSPVQPTPVQAGAVQPAPVQPNPVPPGAAQPSPVQPEPVQPDQVQPQPSTPASGPAWSSSLEGFAFVAMSITQGEPANAYATTNFRRVGVYGEFGAAYRSHYFIDPFLSVGYASLASGDTKLAAGEWGAGGTLHQSLDTWLISPGITSDIWRFRLRLGIGVALIRQRDTFQSDKNTGKQTATAGQLGLGFNCYKTDRFRLDIDARYVKAAGADVSFGLFGITARGDLLTFGDGS
jgi:hypothetical protein